ncbi:MAG: GNAT family N-acetyltransferase [Lachnospiraceae bacterium]|nr:GNAT family N-acetyltransferase [Lachnospiraceae bacterium]
MRVRDAETKDIPRLITLLHQVLELHAKIRPDIFIPGTTKYGIPELEEILRDKNRPVYVAVDDRDTVMGYAMCELEEVTGQVNMVPHKALYLDDLCVDDSLRGQGIGHLLFDHVKQEAKRLGCSVITLNVWEGNESAHAFYQNAGMRIRKTMMELRVP